MKKFISLIAMATLALVCTAGSALADFSAGQLIRVVYDKTSNVEVASDLGTWSSLAGTSGNTVGSSFTGLTGTDYANLQVAYFVYGGNSVNTLPQWTSGEMDVAPAIRNYKFATLTGPLNSTLSYYGTLGTDTVLAAKNNLNSYWTKLDKAGASVGKFASFYNIGFGEANLADLATIGYVDQKLYSFTTPNAASTGVEVAILRTMADGTTTINPTAVPIPASLLLFGSGLLGLVGIRRKSA